MLNSIGSFFQKHFALGEQPSAQSERRRAQLAAAALLVEVAHADQHVTAAERATLIDSIGAKFGLSKHEADELLALAERQARDATDLYQFTSQINRHFTAEQKLRLVEELWRVAYADRTLHPYEEHLIRKVADLIYVSHSAFIAAKHRVRESLS